MFITLSEDILEMTNTNEEEDRLLVEDGPDTPGNNNKSGNSGSGSFLDKCCTIL